MVEVTAATAALRSYLAQMNRATATRNTTTEINACRDTSWPQVSDTAESDTPDVRPKAVVRASRADLIWIGSSVELAISMLAA